MSFGKLFAGALAVCLIVSSANAGVFINEILGSTTSTDSEFIELYNSGAAAVDLTGWSIELWDSDAGTAFGTADGASPYALSGSIPAGGFFLLANTTFGTYYSATPDLLLPENAIENSSYTAILKDASLATIDSVFVTDGGTGDAANDAGTLITPALTAGPDGTFLPAGFARIGDGGTGVLILEFSPQPAPSATPGASNVPEPTSIALVLAGLAGLCFRRR